MFTIFFKRTSQLGLVLLSIVFGGLAAQAETVDAVVTGTTASLPAQDSEAINFTEADTTLFSASNTAAEPVPNLSVAGAPTESTPVSATPSTTVVNTQVEQTQSSAVTSGEAATPVPVSTSAAALLGPTVSQAQLTPEATTGTIAQIPDVTPGQATVSSPSYIGAGVGFDFDSGDPELTILSKIGLTSRISVRPSAVTDFSSAVFRIPVTLDFAPRAQLGRFSVAPFLGGGVAFGVGDESDIGPMITGGVDVPLTTRFTATAGLNVDFLDDTEFGAYVGLGFNFDFPGLLGR